MAETQKHSYQLGIAPKEGGYNVQADSTYQLDFQDLNGNKVELDYSITGNNLVASAENSFIVKATLTAGEYNEKAYQAGSYNFVLTANAIETNTAWQFKDNVDEDKKIALTLENVADAAAADREVTFGTVKVSGLKVYQVIDGKEIDVTETYLANYNTYAKNTDLKSKSGDYEYTYTNFAVVESATVSLNGQNMKDYVYTIAPATNTFIGTKFNEIAYSTQEDETINLSTGNDTAVFNTAFGFGEDTVTITQKEALNLQFVDLNGNTVEAASEIDGNDLKLSVRSTFKLTAELTAGTYDTKDYTAGTYEFALTPDVIEDTYTSWKYEDNELDEHPMVLTTDHLAAIKEDGNVELGTVKLSNVKVYQIVNGKEIDVTGTYFKNASYDYNADLQYAEAEVTNVVTVKNYTTTADFKLTVNDTVYSNVTSNDMQDNNGKFKGSSAAEIISAATYASPDGQKGVNINSGSGNDIVAGSLYNDTITSKTKAGEKATITEEAGKNKLTTGKGNDVINLIGSSFNTVKAGTGNNEITINSTGENKVTAGAGNDTVRVFDGYNNINLGTGNNIANLADGYNTVKTTKGNDTYIIGGGVNNVNSGAGTDIFTINNGTNFIKTGAGDKTFTVNNGTSNIATGKGKDTFTIANGTNVINSNAGDDTFTVNGGTNALYGGAGNDKFVVTAGNNMLNGAKGNDTYDFTGINNLLSAGAVVVNDAAGANSLLLNNAYNNTNTASIYVDFLLNKKGNAVISGDWNLTARANDDANVEGVALTSGNKSSMTIKFGTAENAKTFTVDKAALNEIASSVAAWLKTTNYASTEAVMASENNDAITALIAQYDAASAKFFKEA